MIHGQREWLLAIGVLLSTVLLAYVLIVTTHDTQSEQAIYEDGPSPYVTHPSPYDAHLTTLDRAALDKAYSEYRIRLFEGWMKDPTSQPQRAIFGAEKARDVYIRVLTEIEKRPK